MLRRTVLPIALALSLVGIAPALAAPTLSTSDRLDERRYVATGSRAYVVGTEAGRFPAMGFHTRGEMGGVWTPPIKLVDGIWFGLDGEWVGPATRFTSGYGHVQMDLPSRGGLRVTRTDFAPDGRRAVLVGLRIESEAARTVDLRMQTHSELMSIYPWGETKRENNTQPLTQNEFNLADSAAFEAGALVFREQGTPVVPNAEAHDWAAVVGSTL
ncbi:MAG: glycogen debranching protein, partial [Thermoleophilaceae bacterium]|nr:glycogen debranching protein [Thermoleophilaceae bacterium]